MKPPAGNQRRLLRRAASLAAAGLAISLMSGILACGGDDSPRPNVATTPPETEDVTIEVPVDLTPPPEVTPAPPTHIEIRGRQVPLAPGMVYFEVGAASDPPPDIQAPLWKVELDSSPTEIGHSWLYFDSDFTRLQTVIRPEDQDEFQPIIDALDATRDSDVG